MNEHAKIWIYQASKTFNNEQISQLRLKLLDFTNGWTAHNQQLQAGFEIKYNRFIILTVDESQAGASGCSIDKSVHLMKQIEQEFNIDLFDRFNIAWKEGDFVKSASREEFEELIREGIINSETIVFNNLVPTYSAYLNNWEIPFKNSWHSKVFKLEAI